MKLVESLVSLPKLQIASIEPKKKKMPTGGNH